MLVNKKFLTLLLTTESDEFTTSLNSSLELALFLIKYAFLTDSDITSEIILKRQNPSHGELFFKNSKGARYLDPKYSRWISTDPALGEYMSGSDAGCGGAYNPVNMSLYHYAGNNPIKYVDPDGRAPRNLTEEQRALYKQAITSIDVTKAPEGVVCSTYAAYNYSKAMEKATGEKASYKNLQHNGKKLTGLWGFFASDFYNSVDGPENFSFYVDSNGNRDNSYNSPNIEVGSIGVFGTKNPEGWTGHIWTVTGVERDEDGNVLSISIVEGHSSRVPNEAKISAKDFQEYINGTGPFLGWGEFGKGSASVNDTITIQIKEDTNAMHTKD